MLHRLHNTEVEHEIGSVFEFMGMQFRCEPAMGCERACEGCHWAGSEGFVGCEHPHMGDDTSPMCGEERSDFMMVIFRRI